MDALYLSREEEFDDVVRDLYVAAVTAKRGKLNVKSADELVTRLRAHADRMVLDADADLLREAAGKFERLTDKTKAAELRVNSDDRASRLTTGQTVRPAPGLSIAELLHQMDVEMVNRGRPFHRDQYEGLEARRIEEQNAQLAARNAHFEEQRRNR